VSALDNRLTVVDLLEWLEILPFFVPIPMASAPNFVHLLISLTPSGVFLYQQLLGFLSQSLFAAEINV
jgi:hypothetical protein